MITGLNRPYRSFRSEIANSNKVRRSIYAAKCALRLDPSSVSQVSASQDDRDILNHSLRIGFLSSSVNGDFYAVDSFPEGEALWLDFAKL